MWRIANCVYRAFRNTPTYRCSQDILVPFTTACSADDDSACNRKEICLCVSKLDLKKVLKTNQFTYKNLEKLQEYLKRFAFQQLSTRLDVIKSIEPSKSEGELKALPSVVVVSSSSPPPPLPPPPKKLEETLDSIIQSDETCRNTLQNLSDLREETASIINLDLALDALDSGNEQLGVELLQACTKNKPNEAALFNLGICYERGIGVEKDRAKACDYYRQAALLGHISAQFNLTLLSNDIDIDEGDDDDDRDGEDVTELSEQAINTNEKSFFNKMFSRFSLTIDYEEDQSLNDYQIGLKNQTIACL